MAKLIYGIAGYPVKHSLSPAMQNAAFKELGIDADYSLFEVEPKDLEAFLGSLKANGISGLNITIPHKIKAREYLEKNGFLDANAERLGAVNTIKVTDDGLCGFNTDGPGFYRSLLEDLRLEPEGKNVFVLGAGGAAQAIVMYLGNTPKKIAIYDIDTGKTGDLAKHYAKYFDTGKLFIIPGENEMKASLAQSDLLINATPIGMNEGDPSPVDKTLFHPGLYIYDLVYNRPYTRLVKEANSAKVHAVTGLGMLLCQGAISFEVWTGKKAPVNVMRRALREALQDKEKDRA
jgi:shikimate dehydrogenase